MKQFYFFIITILLFSCSQKQDILDLEKQYQTAVLDIVKQEGTESLKILEFIIQFYGDTKYAQFAYLILADNYLEEISSIGDDDSFQKAETNYKKFLLQSTDQNLIPYVLYKLILLNIKKNKERLLSNNENIQILNNIIIQSKKFILLYPRSHYLEAVKEIILFTQFKLAKHHEQIADWYTQQNHFNSAILRYKYILKKFPEYKEIQQVTQKLIQAVAKSKQFLLLDEYKKIYKEIYNEEIQTI